jgi:YD repeat-containing protein
LNYFTNNTTLRMTVAKNYDYLNRLTGITSAAGGSNVVVFNYANNPANQRTAITNVDSSRWVYQYDALGQVVSGKKYWSDGTPACPVRYYGRIQLRVRASQFARPRVLRGVDRRFETAIPRTRIRASAVHPESSSV